jgi:hypothetical protein
MQQQRDPDCCTPSSTTTPPTVNTTNRDRIQESNDTTGIFFLSQVTELTTLQITVLSLCEGGYYGPHYRATQFSSSRKFRGLTFHCQRYE